MTRLVSFYSLLVFTGIIAIVSVAMYAFGTTPVQFIWGAGASTVAFLFWHFLHEAHEPDVAPHPIQWANYYVYDSYGEGQVLILTEKKLWDGSKKMKPSWAVKSDFIILADTGHVVKNRLGPAS